MKNLALIPARGGSKRLPGKNMRLLAGRPLVGHTLDAAVRCGLFDRIVLSTDSDEIMGVGRAYPEVVIERRPEGLATDTATVHEVAARLMRDYEARGEVYDTINLLLPTCPLRRGRDMAKGLDLLAGEPDVDFVVSVTRYDFPPQKGVMLHADGTAWPAWPNSPLLDGRTRTQDQRPLYHENGAFFICRWSSLARHVHIYRGRVKALVTSAVPDVDIDEEQDLDWAEYVMSGADHGASGNGGRPAVHRGDYSGKKRTRAAEAVRIGSARIGPEEPVFIMAEIGINHNGSLDAAKRLVDIAARCGCNAVKFQKRTPELCVPPDQRTRMRETPWGYISYMAYRERVEFGFDEYAEIDRHCREKNMTWLASAWDEPSVDFLERFDTPAHKVPSAKLTDHGLLRRVRETGRPVILSTGMSTLEEIRGAVECLGAERLILLHCTSTYPCPLGELNLRCLETLRDEFGCLVGYSGHEAGLPPSVGAVAMGAVMIERHITLDRTMWGSDQAASLSPAGLERLVRYVRIMEKSMGSGVKQVWPSEEEARGKLRGQAQGPLVSWGPGPSSVDVGFEGLKVSG